MAHSTMFTFWVALVPSPSDEQNRPSINHPAYTECLVYESVDRRQSIDLFDCVCIFFSNGLKKVASLCWES